MNKQAYDNWKLQAPDNDWVSGATDKEHHNDETTGVSGMVYFKNTGHSDVIEVDEIWLDGMVTKYAENLTCLHLHIVESFVQTFADSRGYECRTIAENVLIYGRSIK